MFAMHHACDKLLCDKLLLLSASQVALLMLVAVALQPVSLQRLLPDMCWDKLHQILSNLRLGHGADNVLRRAHYIMCRSRLALGRSGPEL